MIYVNDFAFGASDLMQMRYEYDGQLLGEVDEAEITALLEE